MERQNKERERKCRQRRDVVELTPGDVYGGWINSGHKRRSQSIRS